MASDKKMVRRAAQTMIDRFGDEALIEVDRRIIELRRCGEHEAEQLWSNIRNVVALLMSKPRNDTKH